MPKKEFKSSELQFLLSLYSAALGLQSRIFVCLSLIVVIHLLNRFILGGRTLYACWSGSQVRNLIGIYLALDIENEEKIFTQVALLKQYT